MNTSFKKIDSKSYEDPTTGVEIFPYESNGSLCPYVMHDSEIGKRFAGYVLILKDLDFAIDCFTLLHTNAVVSEKLRTAVLFAGIFTYMKCFTSGKARGTHLHLDTFDRLPPIQLSRHLTVSEFRNEYLAHASTKTYETSNIALFLNPDKSKKKLLTLSVAAKYATDKDSELIEFIDLIEDVKEQVTKKMKKNMETLKMEVFAIPIDYLYNKCVIPNSLKFKEIRLGKYKEDHS